MDQRTDGRVFMKDGIVFFFFANNGTNERTINMTDLLLTLVDLHFFGGVHFILFLFVGLFFLLKGVEATLGGFVVFEGFKGFVRTWDMMDRRSD